MELLLFAVLLHACVFLLILVIFHPHTIVNYVASETKHKEGFSINQLGNAFKQFGAIFEIFGKFQRIESQIGMFISSFFDAVGSYGRCFFKKLSNWQQCIIPYYLLFEPIRFMIVSLAEAIYYWLLPLPLKYVVDEIGVMMNFMDGGFYGATGYHLIHYSDDTNDKCFTCDSLKPFPDICDDKYKDMRAFFSIKAHCPKADNGKNNDSKNKNDEDASNRLAQFALLILMIIVGMVVVLIGSTIFLSMYVSDGISSAVKGIAQSQSPTPPPLSNSFTAFAQRPILSQ